MRGAAQGCVPHDFVVVVRYPLNKILHLFVPPTTGGRGFSAKALSLASTQALQPVWPQQEGCATDPIGQG